jgi:glycosyltransferase involved in cell wall biosynthesis
MLYLAYFIFAFSAVQLIIAVVNVFFIQQPKKAVSHFNELVSVLIPARNEEANIANLLDDLQNQDYQNIEIIVFNDLSTDKTEEIVNRFTRDDKRIKLINSEGLPNGWLGKNYACHIMSNHARGEYLLFLDADVWLKGGIISNTIAMAEKHHLGLLSIFPKQKMLSIGEIISVPNMNYILLTLLPLVLVRKSKFASLAAANGQFMLFDKSTYFNTLPHEKFKNNKVEDIEIARFYKQKNIPIACLVGNDTIECRMYNGFNEAVNGFSKNVTNFFGNSFFVAILFWVITTFGFIAVFLGFQPEFFVLFLATILTTRVFVSIASRQSILLNLLLLIPQQLALGLFVYKAIFNTLKKQYQWKGRNVSSHL